MEKFSPLNQDPQEAKNTEQKEKKPYDAAIVYGEGPVQEIFGGKREGKGTISYKAEGRMSIYAAGELYQQGKIEKVIVTGGRTGGKNLPSEAEKMKLVLTKRYNIPEENIILEDGASNTIENAAFTANILDQHPEYKNLLGITVSHHLERTKKINERMGINAEYISADDILKKENPKKYNKIFERLAQVPTYVERKKEQTRWQRGLEEIPEYWLPQTAGGIKNIERFRKILADESLDLKGWLKEKFSIEGVNNLSEEELINLKEKIKNTKRILPPEEWAEKE